MSSPLSAILATILLALSGCASYNSQQTHVRYPDESQPRYPAATNSRVYDSTNTNANGSYNNRPRTNASLAPKPANPALGSLVSQAQTQFGQGNYQSAIATAERGLRIERRSPELYLVLAKSYLKLGQADQAAQFANQGLRYSLGGSKEAKALEETRRQALQ